MSRRKRRSEKPPADKVSPEKAPIEANPPKPNKAFLVFASLLLALWITALLILALTSAS